MGAASSSHKERGIFKMMTMAGMHKEKKIDVYINALATAGGYDSVRALVGLTVHELIVMGISPKYAKLIVPFVVSLSVAKITPSHLEDDQKEVLPGISYKCFCIMLPVPKFNGSVEEFLASLDCIQHHTLCASDIAKFMEITMADELLSMNSERWLIMSDTIPSFIARPIEFKIIKREVNLFNENCDHTTVSPIRERRRIQDKAIPAVTPVVPAVSPSVCCGSVAPVVNPSVPALSPVVPAVSPSVPAVSPSVPAVSPSVSVVSPVVPAVSPVVPEDEVGEWDTEDFDFCDASTSETITCSNIRIHDEEVYSDANSIGNTNVSTTDSFVLVESNTIPPEPTEVTLDLPRTILCTTAVPTSNETKSWSSPHETIVAKSTSKKKYDDAVSVSKFVIEDRYALKPQIASFLYSHQVADVDAYLKLRRHATLSHEDANTGGLLAGLVTYLQDYASLKVNVDILAQMANMLHGNMLTGHELIERCLHYHLLSHSPSVLTTFGNGSHWARDGHYKYHACVSKRSCPTLQPVYNDGFFTTPGQPYRNRDLIDKFILAPAPLFSGDTDTWNWNAHSNFKYHAVITGSKWKTPKGVGFTEGFVAPGGGRVVYSKYYVDTWAPDKVMEPLELTALLANSSICAHTTASPGACRNRIHYLEPWAKDSADIEGFQSAQPIDDLIQSLQDNKWFTRELTDRLVAGKYEGSSSAIKPHWTLTDPVIALGRPSRPETRPLMNLLEPWPQQFFTSEGSLADEDFLGDCGKQMTERLFANGYQSGSSPVKPKWTVDDVVPVIKITTNPAPRMHQTLSVFMHKQIVCSNGLSDSLDNLFDKADCDVVDSPTRVKSSVSERYVDSGNVLCDADVAAFKGTFESFLNSETIATRRCNEVSDEVFTGADDPVRLVLTAGVPTEQPCYGKTAHYYDEMREFYRSDAATAFANNPSVRMKTRMRWVSFSLMNSFDDVDRVNPLVVALGKINSLLGMVKPVFCSLNNYIRARIKVPWGIRVTDPELTTYFPRILLTLVKYLFGAKCAHELPWNSTKLPWNTTGLEWMIVDADDSRIIMDALGPWIHSQLGILDVSEQNIQTPSIIVAVATQLFDLYTAKMSGKLLDVPYSIGKRTADCHDSTTIFPTNHPDGWYDDNLRTYKDNSNLVDKVAWSYSEADSLSIDIGTTASRRIEDLWYGQVKKYQPLLQCHHMGIVRNAFDLYVVKSLDEVTSKEVTLNVSEGNENLPLGVYKKRIKLLAKRLTCRSRIVCQGSFYAFCKDPVDATTTVRFDYDKKDVYQRLLQFVTLSQYNSECNWYDDGTGETKYIHEGDCSDVWCKHNMFLHPLDRTESTCKSRGKFNRNMPVDAWRSYIQGLDRVQDRFRWSGSVEIDSNYDSNEWSYSEADSLSIDIGTTASRRIEDLWYGQVKKYQPLLQCHHMGIVRNAFDLYVVKSLDEVTSKEVTLNVSEGNENLPLGVYKKRIKLLAKRLTCRSRIVCQGSFYAFCKDPVDATTTVRFDYDKKDVYQRLLQFVTLSQYNSECNWYDDGTGETKYIHEGNCSDVWCKHNKCKCGKSTGECKGSAALPVGALRRYIPGLDMVHQGLTIVGITPDRFEIVEKDEYLDGPRTQYLKRCDSGLVRKFVIDAAAASKHKIRWGRTRRNSACDPAKQLETFYRSFGLTVSQFISVSDSATVAREEETGEEQHHKMGFALYTIIFSSVNDGNCNVRFFEESNED